jgi:diguanylate cyclase (GGDEF)-like protein
LTDSLTLLYSRRFLHETAEAEARRASAVGRPFAVALVELSGIGELNRREGYAEGDRAIQRAARAVLAAASRRGGTAFRFGGNRLAVVLPGDEGHARECTVELEAALEPGLRARTATAVWREGDSGDDVVARAREELGSPSGASAPAAPAWDHVRSWPPAD